MGFLNEFQPRRPKDKPTQGQKAAIRAATKEVR
jgi:hypothetical protein